MEEDKKQQTAEQEEVHEETVQPEPEKKEQPAKEAAPKKASKPKKKADAEIAKLKEEQAALKDQLMRQMAEFDNYRKRTVKEKAGTYEDAKANTLKDLVPVLDSFERAAEAACSDETYKEGVMMLLTQFKDALKKLGVEEIEAEGKPLDPTCHQAVMQEETEEVESGCVTKVLQKGYKLGDRVLRTAMVAVAQ